MIIKNFGHRYLKNLLASFVVIILLTDGAIKNDWNNIILEIIQEIVNGMLFIILFFFKNNKTYSIEWVPYRWPLGTYFELFKKILSNFVLWIRLYVY